MWCVHSQAITFVPKGPSLVINPTFVMNLFDLSSFQGKSKIFFFEYRYCINIANGRKKI
jgi:hypothetical protein